MSVSKIIFYLLVSINDFLVKDNKIQTSEVKFVNKKHSLSSIGCPNIDETVGVIKACAKPLQDLGGNTPMEDVCRFVEYLISLQFYGKDLVYL